MPKFKDKTTGTIIEVMDNYDVSQMKIHPDYEEVTEIVTQEKNTTTLTLPKKDK